MLEILEKPKVKAFMLFIVLLELYLILPFEGSIATKVIFISSCLAIYYQYLIWKIDYRIKVLRSKGKATS